MKKSFAVALLLFFTMTIAFSYSFTIAYSESGYEIRMTIDGEEYTENVMISEDVIVKVGGSFYNFAAEKLADGVDPENLLNYISPSLGSGFFNVLCERETDSVDAAMTVDEKKGKFSYIDGKNGKAYDKVEACLAIAKSLDGKRTDLRIKETLPNITLAELKRRTRLIGRFATDLAGSSEERKHNVKTAADYINGFRLSSGERFSFNEVVGARTEERGFKKAKVIIDGEYTYGYGGGVCQTATTLYNAVLLSGLKTVRVSRHSYPARYVGYSRDAMVSSSSDFIFENDGEYDVFIFARVIRNSVEVEIYGDKRGNYTLLSVETGRTPFVATDESGKIIVPDETYKIVSNGIEGVKSELYIIDSFGVKKRVRRDTYKTKNAVYKKIDEISE